MATPIKACLACGSRDLNMMRLEDGLAAEGGELLKNVCGACGWQGQPILFAREAQYKAFLQALRDEE